MLVCLCSTKQKEISWPTVGTNNIKILESWTNWNSRKTIWTTVENHCTHGVDVLLSKIVCKKNKSMFWNGTKRKYIKMKQDVSTASPEKASDKYNIAASVTLDPKSSFPPPKNKHTHCSSTPSHPRSSGSSLRLPKEATVTKVDQTKAY